MAINTALLDSAQNPDFSMLLLTHTAENAASERIQTCSDAGAIAPPPAQPVAAARGGVVHEIDPIGDFRWADFLQRDPRASVFHTPGWLAALQRTYGYRPVVFTTSRLQEPLNNGLVFCQVESWLTGRRLVALPFSDHCEPLLTAEAQTVIAACLPEHVKNGRWKYAELRPLTSASNAGREFSQSGSFCFHQIDLRPNLDVIFQNLHKSSTRRKIQRAEREGITYQQGTSPVLLDQFYRLFVMTRRRHGLPPSPRAWFFNILDCLGGNAQVRIAYKGDVAVAAMITLKYKDVIMYKYGASDSAFNNLGAMVALFWKAIAEAKSEGFRAFDLGRSDWDNDGLLTFKDHLGGVRSSLTYWRWPATPSHGSGSGWKSGIAKRLLAHAPDAVRIKVGDLLYRHIG